MGCGSSALKEEVERLEDQVERLEAERKAALTEKRDLVREVALLKEMTATAQLDAERSWSEAEMNRKRAEATKYELLQLLSPGSATSPRHRLSWKLREDSSASLRRMHSPMGRRSLSPNSSSSSFASPTFASSSSTTPSPQTVLSTPEQRSSHKENRKQQKQPPVHNNDVQLISEDQLKAKMELKSKATALVSMANELRNSSTTMETNNHQQQHQHVDPSARILSHVDEDFVHVDLDTIEKDPTS